MKPRVVLADDHALPRRRARRLGASRDRGEAETVASRAMIIASDRTSSCWTSTSRTAAARR